LGGGGVGSAGFSFSKVLVSLSWVRSCADAVSEVKLSSAVAAIAVRQKKFGIMSAPEADLGKKRSRVYTSREREVKAARSRRKIGRWWKNTQGFCIDVQIKELLEKGFVRVWKQSVKKSMSDDDAAFRLWEKRRGRPWRRRGGTTYPGCFVERVWICLIAKEWSFFGATKSPQERVNEGVSVFEGWREKSSRKFWKREHASRFRKKRAGNGFSAASAADL
jgi:hypothetical protein